MAENSWLDTLRYGCGSTATKLSACGPTCGSDSRTGCVEVSNLTKRNSQATAKLNLLDPTLRAKRRRKFESTMMERYGATSANLVPELAAKARATCLERYGVEYGSQSKELMSTARVRYKKEHGVDHWTQLESTQLARKATCIERYGVEHSIQAQEVVERRRKNNLLKHGVIHPMQIPELAAAKYATWLRRNGAAFGSNKWRKSWVEDYQRIHGVAQPSQTAETHKCWTATNLERHGANYPVQCPSIMASHVSTLMSRYGVTNITHIPGAKEKARATTRELFGADYAIQSEEGQRRYKENSLNKHGVENPTQNPQVFRRILASLYSTHPLTLPSGRIVKYQGYENRSILRQLLTHTEDQIDFNAELAIPWTKNSGKRGMYFPDLTIPSERRLIEVKSPYTFERGLTDGTLLAKMVGALNAGWEATIEVWAAKGNLPLFEIDSRKLLGVGYSSPG